MIGSEVNPLQPFRTVFECQVVMQADMVWLPKWCKVLVSRWQQVAVSLLITMYKNEVYIHLYIYIYLAAWCICLHAH